MICNISMVEMVYARLNTVLTTYCRNMNNLFSALLDAPRSSVYALVNEVDKTVYVSYSTSVITSLARLIERHRNDIGFRYKLGEDLSKFSFVVLEENDCRNTLMVRVGLYMRRYKNTGYTLLDERVPVEYRLKVMKMDDGKSSSKGLGLYLVSKRNSKILLGTFRTRKELESFQNEYYPNGYDYEIIYSEK